MENLIIVARILYSLAALLMIGAILLQESKGGGLSSLGGTQAESAFGSSNPIRRMTVFLAIIFFGLGVTINIIQNNNEPELQEDPAPVVDAKADDKTPIEPVKDNTPPVATPKEPEPVPVAPETTPAEPVAPVAPVAPAAPAVE